MNYKKYIIANAFSFFLITISLLMIGVVTKNVWTYWQHNAFLPRMEDILKRSRQRNNPSFCRLSTSPAYCMDHLMYPNDDDRTWDPQKAHYTYAVPIVFNCNSVSDSDIRTLCEVRINKKVNRDSCKNIVSLFAKNDCLVALARQMKEVNVCEDIVPTMLPGTISDATNWKEALRAYCIHAVAVELYDPSLCNRLPDPYRRNECMQYVPKK